MRLFSFENAKKSAIDSKIAVKMVQGVFHFFSNCI